MSRRRALAAALFAAALLTLALARPGPGQDPAEPRPPTCVFLVRHAEKASGEGVDPRDPGLSEAGLERARALARALGGAGVTHLFATEFQRTRATLAPLAEALGLDVTVVPAAETARQVEALRALPRGAVAVVAGHSNTVPALAAALGGELADLHQHPRYGAMLPDDEYDRMVLVVLPGGPQAAPRALELRYGPASPSGPK